MNIISDKHIILDDGTSIEVGKRYFFQDWGARFILIKSIKTYDDNTCWITYYEDVFLHKLTDDILTEGRFVENGNNDISDTIKQYRISHNGMDFISFSVDEMGVKIIEELPEQLFIDVVNKKFKSILDYYTTIPPYIYISDSKEKEDVMYIMSYGIIRDDANAYIRTRKLEKLLESI